MKRVFKDWNLLSRDVVESQALEEFKMCGDSIKGHVLVIGLGRSGWWLGLMIIKVFSNLRDCDSENEIY